MKITVSDFISKFRALVGDSSESIPNNFLIEAINLSINKVVSVPQLSRAFRKHFNTTLNAKNGHKWKLEGDFRRLADIDMLNFYSIGEGGIPCPLNLCALDVEAFYNKHGIVAMKKPGVPCEFTIEQEDDDTYLILDRPSDVPIMIDYIVYGYPAPISDLTTIDPKTKKPVPTTIELSAVIENIILNSMREAYYAEAEDLAFAGATLDILSNKYIPEAIQMLNKRLGIMRPTILGEA